MQIRHGQTCSPSLLPGWQGWERGLSSAQAAHFRVGNAVVQQLGAHVFWRPAPSAACQQGQAGLQTAQTPAEAGIPPQVGVDTLQPGPHSPKASCKAKVTQLEDCRAALVQQGVVQLQVPAGQHALSPVSCVHASAVHHHRSRSQTYLWAMPCWWQ